MFPTGARVWLRERGEIINECGSLFRDEVRQVFVLRELELPTRVALTPPFVAGETIWVGYHVVSGPDAAAFLDSLSRTVHVNGVRLAAPADSLQGMYAGSHSTPAPGLLALVAAVAAAFALRSRTARRLR